MPAVSRPLTVQAVRPKSILSASKVYPYVVNPYVGCQHGCTFCYARFMRRFTGHREPWGEFVDVKVNAPELLRAEITRKRVGRVWVSGVCDPYQPLEAEHALTRRCLEILAEHGWPVTVQTRSPLVVRDIDVLTRGREWEAGMSIATGDDDVRALFEPHAPPIEERIRALAAVHAAGVRTYVMIAPMLPGAERLLPRLNGFIDRLIIDRMNYHNADWVYRRYGLEEAMTDAFFGRMRETLLAQAARLGIPC